MQNTQANEAGKRADEIIKNLANPSDPIVTDNIEVAVPHPSEQPANEVAPVPLDDYETRFKRYKASTDITIRDLRQKVTQLESYEAENIQLKSKLEDAQAQIPSTPNEMLEVFSTEEASAVDKMLEGKVGGLKDEVDRLNKELETTRQDKQKEVAVSTHQRVIDTVKNAVPNYEAIDKDPKFAEYMNDLDTFGNVRLDLLIKAKNSVTPDVGRIVQFYRDFANSNTVQEAPAVTRQTYTQQELLQNPSSTSTERPSSPQGLGINWDTSTVSQLYKDKATNKISNEQFTELEKDMRRSKGWQT